MASPRSLYGRKAPPSASVKNACAHNGSPATPRDATMVSEVVFGWGGTGPRESVAAKASDLFTGAAGAKTAGLGPASVSPRKKSIRGMDDSIDAHIRDDLNQAGPHPKYLTRYGSFAGIGTAETIVSTLKQRKRIQGCLDEQNFGDHAGYRAREVRSMKGRCLLSLESGVDNLWHGVEDYAEEPHFEAMKQIGAGAAGLRPPRKDRQKGGMLQVKSSVNEVVFGRAPSSHYAQYDVGEYLDSFREHAGIKTGQTLMRSMSFPGPQSARTLKSPPCEELKNTMEVGVDTADLAQGENIEPGESLQHEKVEPGELMQHSAPVTKTLTFKDRRSSGSGSTRSTCSSRGSGQQPRWRH